MKPLDFPLLADANVQRAVVEAIRGHGYDIVSLADRALEHASDRDLLVAAFAEGRVVVTHDADFGSLAIRQGVALFGLIYLRPGHIEPARVLESLEAPRSAPVDVTTPFVAVVERRGGTIRVRVRQGTAN